MHMLLLCNYLSVSSESFQMLLGKLCFQSDCHGLPSCKACLMTIQLQYWRVFTFSFSSSVFAFSFQGLAHLKAEQGTLSSLYCFFLLRSSHRPGLGPLALCTLTSCPCWFVCCDDPLVAVEEQHGVFVRAARGGCMRLMHVPRLTSTLLLLPPRLLLALRNCGWLWFLQLRCADTLHCSCLTFGASGEEKLGWQDKRNELIRE